MTPSATSIPPPSFLQIDEEETAKPSQKRFSRSPFRRAPHPKPVKDSVSNGAGRTHTSDVQNTDGALSITSQIGELSLSDATTTLKPHVYDQQEFQDQYQWAILYENQRGLNIFSTAYYSRLSLLPNDPLPFTMPNAGKHRSEQFKVSLSNYPLPDGSWRWASKSWMVDMRGATGQVQHDGFEYNLLFRKHKWHAASKLSSGAFVRRRRWLRLMVRPARQDTHNSRHHTDANDDGDTHLVRRDSPESSPIDTAQDPFEVYPREVFVGHDADEDWKRCHTLLKSAGRDGKKLELWHHWLGLKHMDLSSTIGKSKMRHVKKQWSEDSEPLPSEVAAHDAWVAHVPISDPPVQQISAVLQIHANHIMESFVYPESRAHLVELFALAGALPYVLHGGGDTSSWLARYLDFYSYIKDLEIRFSVQGGNASSVDDS